MKRFTVLLLLVLGMVSISQAEMVADFEGTGFDGFSAIGSPLSTLSTDTTALAVTSGAKCLKVVHAPNFWPIRWTPTVMPTRLRKLQMDVTFIAAEWSGQWTRFNQKMSLHFGPVGPGYAETPDTTTANWKYRNGTGVCPVDWGSWAGDEQATFTIDLSSFNANLAGNTEMYINFSFNSGGACPYYIDNVHWVDEPYNPNPANGGLGGLSTNLSWSNATDSLNEVNVWFGIPPEPNLADPNTILNMDTYKTLLTKVYTEANPGATSTCPNANIGTLTDGQEYTWCVESDPNTIPVLFWTFTATPNEAPIVVAGVDQDLYLGGDPNIVATLDGSASSDDGLIAPLTYAWAQTAGPTVTIDSPNTATTTVTLSELANSVETWNAPAADAYVFELTVDDGQVQVTDSVSVTLSTNSCVASVEAGSYYFYGDIAGPAGSGPENRDCKIDLLDFAEMAVNWLGCSNTFEACL